MSRFDVRVKWAVVTSRVKGTCGRRCPAHVQPVDLLPMHISRESRVVWRPHELKRKKRASPSDVSIHQSIHQTDPGM